MATFQSLEEIEAWKKARELTQSIYKASSTGLFSKDFGLRDQMRRASVSVMSNIAEGFERNGKKEFAQFLAVAKGSLGEIRSQLYVAFDQNYIDQEMFTFLYAKTNEIARLIGGLMNYLNRSGFKGTKYKSPETRNSKPETFIA